MRLICVLIANLGFHFFLLSQSSHYQLLSAEDGLPSNQVHTVYSDSKGYLWLGTPNGAVRWDSKYFKIYTIEDGLPNNEVLGFLKDSRGRLWIGTFSNELSYLKNDKIYSKKNDKKINIKSIFSGTVPFEYQGGLYIKLLSNFKYIDVVSLQDKVFPSQKDTSHMLANNVFSYNGVLYGFDRSFFSKNQMNRNIIDSLNLKGFSISFQKHLYIKELNQYMIDSYLYPKYKLRDLYFNKKEYRAYECHNMLLIIDENCRIYRKNNPIVHVNSKNVSHILQMKDEIKYITNNTLFNLRNYSFGKVNKGYGSTYNVDKTKIGNYILTTSEEVFELYPRKKICISGLISGNFKYSSYDVITRRYFVGSSSGLVCIKNNVMKLLTSERNYCNFMDSRHRLWYSGLSNLKFCDNFKDTIVNPKIFEIEKSTTVLVKQIKEDKYGNILFSTNNGIYIYDHKTKLKYHLNKSNFLTTNEVTKIYLDSTNNSFWIATPKGLLHIQYFYRKGKLVFKTVNRFFKEDGLPSSEINDVAIDGDSIWVATPKGLSLIVNKNYKPDTTHIPIYVNQFKVNDSLFSVRSNYKLSYTQNNISIDYSAIYFLRRDRLNVKYRLIKSEDTFNYTTSDNKIMLQALESGDYILQIYAYDIDYPYNKSDVYTITFKIEPPFYRTWWFYMIVLLSLIAIASSILLTISKRKHDKLLYEKKLSQFQLEALKAEMNPHFIFNALNSIKESMMDGDFDKSQTYLSKLAKLIRHALYNTKSDLILLEDEIKFIDLYIDLEQLRFNHKFDYIKEVADSCLVYKVPTMLLQPFFENAVRHGRLGQLGYQGKLRFEVLEDDKYLYIRIRDNGIGLTKSKELKERYTDKEHKSMALEIIQNRIALYQKSNSIQIGLSIRELTDSEYRTEVEITMEKEKLI